MLRGEALEQLLAELVGDDDRTLAVEEFTVPGRAAPGEAESDAPSGAEGREEVVAAALNAAQSPPFMTGRRIIVLHEAGNLGAGDVAPLVTYLARPLDTTAFVVAGGGRASPEEPRRRVEGGEGRQGGAGRREDGRRARAAPRRRRDRAPPRRGEARDDAPG